MWLFGTQISCLKRLQWPDCTPPLPCAGDRVAKVSSDMGPTARRTGSVTRVSHDLGRTDSATGGNIAETWIVRQYCDAGSLQVCVHRASARPVPRPRQLPPASVEQIGSSLASIRLGCAEAL